MPGIDTDLAELGLDDLPARLAQLLRDATDAVERRAAEPKASPDATMRSVGVIARTGAAVATFAERLARLRGRAAGDTDDMEEAGMDDAEDAGAVSAEDEAAHIERGLRDLARNLRIGGGAGAHGTGAAGDGAPPGDGLLGGESASAPAPA